MKQFWKKLSLGCLIFVLGLLIWAAEPAIHTQAEATDVQPMRTAAVESAVAPNCRYGVSDTGASEFFDDLGIGWTVNFVTTDADYGPVEYMPILRITQKRDGQGNRLPAYEMRLGTPELNDTPTGLGPMVLANPGQLWLVGNEVDRITYQDDIMPEIYAIAYHDIYHFIKQRDPSARVAISGLVEVSPGRLQYLDLMWEAYLARYNAPMPVDVWNMHAYALPERQAGNGQDAAAAVALGTDPNLAIWDSGGNPAQCGRNDVLCFAEHDSMAQLQYQVTAMRQWMRNRGQQQKPLIISEFSILYPYATAGGVCEFLQDEYGNCFTPSRVTQFMTNSFDYLETAADPNLGYALDNNKLVQTWLWYPSKVTSNEDVGSSSKLITNNGSSLTSLGNAYKTYVASEPRAVNLVVERASNVAVNVPVSATVQIEVVVRNNGNVPTTQPITVQFFDGADALIGSTVIPAGLGGCALQTAVAQITWAGLPPGLHPFTVDVSSAEDSNANDSSGAGLVFVNPQQSWLPLSTAASNRGQSIMSPP